MQQTSLDLWMRRKFIYLNRVYCNTLPDRLPLGLVVEEAPEESGGRYLYKISTRSENLLKELVISLEMQNITYTSRVDDRQVWYSKYLNDPQKSFTFRVVWILIAVLGLGFSLSGAPKLIWNALVGEEVEEVAGPVDEDAKIYHKQDTVREIDRVK